MGIMLKLLTVQQALKAPKDQFNSFGKYSYRSCESVLEALKPLLAMNQMALVLSDEIKEIGGRVYVEATATIYDAETGEKLSVTASAREEEAKKGMDASQVTGASSSYARKYALNGLFAIDDNKDSDATNKGDQPLKPIPKSAPAIDMTPPPEPEFRCDNCKKVIKPYTDPSGKIISVDRWVKGSVAKFNGAILCPECVEERKRR